ncbi:hypothetical protein DSS3P1_82 [Ruegeria phage DSS3-P1]|uniref:hypothetical protein n=1 Tax=Ruegeria phage DSS3-P1 TaxID=1555208 RepID=UPI00051AA18B|nr:hypothetical protein DSS3P1_82 [Ruegeria phage DSS3-P1]YP_009997299.1 hypothetical protein JT312_gp82 [Ruegeria phage vB_RpoS-V18]YP_009997381.1 hypothetical protein JT313_gp82 [Ruegeria phage vB_RpoS-V11]YP_009997465.1 hypothetical protein JT314_gp84 [Ruegeria phage vB_RpoS-V7]AIT13317.1 hypothetical protein DSS3P1_82 [Ruegeria phage DSS3-P1]AWY08787.1 hypothetical protein vBRpoSV7_84 [Ruegeria phage vB_RpoS-V7]AWY08958.1 hypothetical protein vBRpoSV18_82 [Ruegeria phage vB_RpoS-V18]AWY0
MKETMFVAPGARVGWWTRLDAPFDVGEALDEVGYYAGDLLARQYEFFDPDGEEKPDGLVPVAEVQRITDEADLNGHWRVYIEDANEREKMHEVTRVFRSSYAAVASLTEAIPRNLVGVVPRP